jgi:hypothetical protein
MTMETRIDCSTCHNNGTYLYNITGRRTCMTCGVNYAAVPSVNLTADPEPVKVGDRVFCTVTAIRMWVTVTQVKGSGSKLRIKTDSFTGWGYGHNFTRNPPDWMMRSNIL